jgi:hypothetical protein
MVSDWQWKRRAVWPLHKALEASLRAEGIGLPLDSSGPFGVVNVGWMGNISVVPCVDIGVGPDGRSREVWSWEVFTPPKLYEPYVKGASYNRDFHNSESFGDQASAVQAATKAAVLLMEHPHYSEEERVSAEIEAFRRANPRMDEDEAARQWIQSKVYGPQEDAGGRTAG